MNARDYTPASDEVLRFAIGEFPTTHAAEATLAEGILLAGDLVAGIFLVSALKALDTPSLAGKFVVSLGGWLTFVAFLVSGLAMVWVGPSAIEQRPDNRSVIARHLATR